MQKGGEREEDERRKKEESCLPEGELSISLIEGGNS